MSNTVGPTSFSKNFLAKFPNLYLVFAKPSCILLSPEKISANLFNYLLCYFLFVAIECCYWSILVLTLSLNLFPFAFIIDISFSFLFTLFSLFGWMLLSFGFCFLWVLGGLFLPPSHCPVTLKADCGVVAHAPDVTSHCPGFRPFTRSARHLYRGHIHIATADTWIRNSLHCPQ